MKIVDANFILRYLLNDIEEQAQYAYEILSNESVHLLHEVIAEIVYVLEKVYKVERTNISSELLDLIENSNVETSNLEIIIHALDTFSKSKLDFIYCILCAYAKISEAKIYTFDKKLINAIKK